MKEERKRNKQNKNKIAKSSYVFCIIVINGYITSEEE